MSEAIIESAIWALERGIKSQESADALRQLLAQAEPDHIRDATEKVDAVIAPELLKTLIDVRDSLSALRTDIGHPVKGTILAWNSNRLLIEIVDEVIEKAKKQALAQQEKDCVAIVNEGMGGIEWLSKPLPDDTPLYAAPPKREWVGLTEREARAIGDGFENDKGHIQSWMSFARHIEAKLKEKNA